MSRLRSCIAWCLLSAAAVAQSQSIRRLDGSRITTQEADAFARETLAAHNVTGAQIAVLNGGRPVWSFAYGLAGKDPDRAFDRETATWSGSITKGIVATYAMRLVERGELQLDVPVAQQLPVPLTGLPRYSTIGVELVKDPQWPRVTLRMLLAHTSGLGNIASIEPGGLLRLHFVPGARYGYSTEGFNLIGALIEARSGQSLEASMQREVFEPLGMKRTGLVFRSSLAPNIADRFDRNEKFLSWTRRDSVRAGGSMTASTDDVARFLAALVSGSLLSKKSMQQMLSPQVEIPFAHQFQFGDRLLEQADEPKAVGLAYGLGWGLLTKTRYGNAFFKEGHGDGAQTYAVCFDRHQTCMVIQTNSDNGELAFRPLLERILGDTVTPWEWECYTPECIARSREQ